jgi:hypothetical protein
MAPGRGRSPRRPGSRCHPHWRRTPTTRSRCSTCQSWHSIVCSRSCPRHRSMDGFWVCHGVRLRGAQGSMIHGQLLGTPHLEEVGSRSRRRRVQGMGGDLAYRAAAAACPWPNRRSGWADSLACAWPPLLCSSLPTATNSLPQMMYLGLIPHSASPKPPRHTGFAELRGLITRYSKLRGVKCPIPNLRGFSGPNPKLRGVI